MARLKIKSKEKRISETKDPHHVAWWVHGHQAYDKINI